MEVLSWGRDNISVIKQLTSMGFTEKLCLEKKILGLRVIDSYLTLFLKLAHERHIQGGGVLKGQACCLVVGYPYNVDKPWVTSRKGEGEGER